MSPDMTPDRPTHTATYTCRGCGATVCVERFDEARVSYGVTVCECGVGTSISVPIRKEYAGGVSRE